MIAALGTLAFLATLWFLVVVCAAIVEESGAKIAAALKGQSIAGMQRQIAYARFRLRPRFTRPMRGKSRLRAAA